MGKRKQDKPQYTCSVQYTQGCSQRLTQALVEVYYNRKKGISKDQEAVPFDHNKEST